MKIIGVNVTGSFILNGVDVTTTIQSSSIWSGSVASSINSLNVATSSINSSISSLNAATSSLYTATSSINSSITSLNATTASLNTTTASINLSIGSLNATTASLNTITSSLNSSVTALNATTSSLLSFTSSQASLNSAFATTGSNTFNGTQTLSGSLLTSGSITATGTITAQTLVVQTVTSSVSFITGSTKFGSLGINSHQFTGSLSVTGSLSSTSLTGSIAYSNLTGVPTLVSGSSQIIYSSISSIPAGIVSGSAQVTFGSISSIPSGLVSGSSQVSIASTTGFGTYINQALLTTSTPTFSTVSATTFTGALSGNATTVTNGVYTNASQNNLSGVFNFGSSGATPYNNPTGTSNGISFGGIEASSLRTYGIFTEQENVGGNYSKLTINYHTGVRIGASTSYGGTRFYNNFAGGAGGGTEIFSVGNGDNHVRVANNLYVTGTIGGSNLSGTNTGDQTNISGNAATATLATTATAAAGATFQTQNNATWAARIQLGGNGDPGAVTNVAVVQATDGNLHIDCGTGKSTYINYYRNGIIYLNGATYYISSNGSQYNGNAATTSQTAFSTLTVNSNTTTGTAAGVVNLGTTGDPSDNANSSVIGLTWGLRGDSSPYYIVRSNRMTYGSYTYNRLDLSWHTGLQMGAATAYGGTRIYNNSTFIGTQIVSIGDGDNKLRCTDDIIAYASDKRLKENITNIPNALDKVLKINGVYFDWKDKTKELGFFPSQKNDVGVIAQEIQAILPEVVTLAPFDYELGKSKSGENYLTVKYDKIVPLLIEAIKEQQTQIEELKTIINGLTK